MKIFVSYISLFCIFTFLAVSSHANASIPYKIKGEVISELPDISEQEEADAETDGDESDAVLEESETSTNAPAVEPVDLSDAVLTISHEVINDEGEVETITLLEEHFDGTFDYNGVIDEPTAVKITLQVSEDLEPMEIDTVIGTGRDVHFALVDDPGWDPEITLIGTASDVLDPEKKFTISGDLSFLNTDLDDTTVYLNWKEFDNGVSRNKRVTLRMHNNSFIIEGNTDVPQVAELWVIGLNIPDVFVTFDVVLEPHGNFTLSQLGNQNDEFGVSSEYGYHALLIDSWQQQEEFLNLKERITKENERLQELIESGAEDADNELTDHKAASEGANKKVEVPAVSTTPEPAEGCEDAVAQTTREVAQPTKGVQHQALRSKISSMLRDLDDHRTTAMKEIAASHQDPMARYLAVRLNPWERREYTPRISILRELEKVMDADFVSVHVTPLIGRMEQSALKASNDSRLVVGQRVPEFSLVNYDGEDVVLFDLIKERDLVLIDFWASWCGPCIADFPELKKLYSAYSDEGFEIVGVSIDDNMEDWKDSVDEHELPWVNLGELKDWDGPVAVSYGVNAIPKGYLVDSQGCIYEKNIRPWDLKDFLVNRYGMDESLEEPEEETEDSQEVSS